MASGAPKLVVFGANGYVGSTIAKAAVAAGVRVVGASSTGNRPISNRYDPPPPIVAPKKYDPAEVASATTKTSTAMVESMENEGPKTWVDLVEWSKVDALKRENVAEFLDYHSDATAVISSIGALTLNHHNARRINGDANVNIAAAVFERPAVRRLVYISAAQMRPATAVLKGYYAGKVAMERALFETLGGRGVALRPGMVSGTRVATSYGVPLPLYVVGRPMELLFRPLHSLTGLSLLTPPSTVEDVAAAALYAALQQPEPFPERTTFPGYSEIHELAGRWTPSAVSKGPAAVAKQAEVASESGATKTGV